MHIQLHTNAPACTKGAYAHARVSQTGKSTHGRLHAHTRAHVKTDTLGHHVISNRLHTQMSTPTQIMMRTNTDVKRRIVH